MLTNTLISKILGMTPQGAGKWKKEDRPIIDLLNKYFSENDLKEFLESGKVSKFEQLHNTENKVDDTNIILIDYTKYQLRDKLQNITDKNTAEWLWYFFAKKILVKVLNKLSSNSKTTAIMHSKEVLINEIQSTDISSFYKGNRNTLIELIQTRLSDLECYVLINYHEEVLNYGKFGLKPTFDSK